MNSTPERPGQATLKRTHATDTYGSLARVGEDLAHVGRIVGIGHEPQLLIVELADPFLEAHVADEFVANLEVVLGGAPARREDALHRARHNNRVACHNDCQCDTLAEAAWCRCHQQMANEVPSSCTLDALTDSRPIVWSHNVLSNLLCHLGVEVPLKVTTLDAAPLLTELLEQTQPVLAARRQFRVRWIHDIVLAQQDAL